MHSRTGSKNTINTMKHKYCISLYYTTCITCIHDLLLSERPALPVAHLFTFVEWSAEAGGHHITRSSDFTTLLLPAPRGLPGSTSISVLLLDLKG